MTSLFIVYNITISWLYPLHGFWFYFLLRDNAHTLYPGSICSWQTDETKQEKNKSKHYQVPATQWLQSIRMRLKLNTSCISRERYRTSSQTETHKSTGYPWPHERRVGLFVRNVKKCMGEYWRVLYRKLISRTGTKLKLKINVHLLQLLCIVVSVALHGEFFR